MPVQRALQRPPEPALPNRAAPCSPTMLGELIQPKNRALDGVPTLPDDAAVDPRADPASA